MHISDKPATAQPMIINIFMYLRSQCFDKLTSSLDASDVEARTGVVTQIGRSEIESPTGLSQASRFNEVIYLYFYFLRYQNMSDLKNKTTKIILVA